MSLTAISSLEWLADARNGSHEKQLIPDLRENNFS